jgi:hypothetical protein
MWEAETTTGNSPTRSARNRTGVLPASMLSLTPRPGISIVPMAASERTSN